MLPGHEAIARSSSAVLTDPANLPAHAVLALPPAETVVPAAGFRITACAATPDQAAFVLSVPRRRPTDETQETLRTSAFPSAHVKEKWAKNLYIAGVAYGRTVS